MYIGRYVRTIYVELIEVTNESAMETRRPKLVGDRHRSVNHPRPSDGDFGVERVATPEPLVSRSKVISVNNRDIWRAGSPMMARCKTCSAPDEEWARLVGGCPQESCTCGIYAVKHFKYCQGAITGQVLIWGKVIEGDHGYRAQYAYPRSIYLRALHWHLRHQLRSAYGIDVIPAPLLAKHFNDPSTIALDGIRCGIEGRGS